MVQMILARRPTDDGLRDEVSIVDLDCASFNVFRV